MKLLAEEWKEFVHEHCEEKSNEMYNRYNNNPNIREIIKNKKNLNSSSKWKKKKLYIYIYILYQIPSQKTDGSLTGYTWGY